MSRSRKELNNSARNTNKDHHQNNKMLLSTVAVATDSHIFNM